MIRGAFDGVAEMFALMAILCLTFVPLGIWKLVDIAIWIYSNVEVSVK